MMKWLRPSLNWLLVFIPLALVAKFVWHNDLFVFGAAALSIVPLAGMIGTATEQLALHVGSKLGGLLNATFGNVTELIVATFLIIDGELDVAKASLTGSILGNMLLILGLAFLLGGLKHKEQTFDARAAGLHTTSLILAVVGLLMPAVFVRASSSTFVEREVLSVAVAVVLMSMYVATLVFTLKTHSTLFRTVEEDEKPDWSLARAIAVLAGAVVVVAGMSELLVASLDPAVEALHLSKLFVGLIVVPVIANAAEHSAAVMLAMRNKMDVALEIAIGSSVQVALFVAPFLVLISLAVGHPMNFVFTTFEIAAVAVAMLIVGDIASDGRSNWLEGAQLLGAYAIMAISFFFLN